MRVILYQLDFKELMNPNIEFLNANSEEELDRLIEFKRPNLLLVRENDVSTALLLAQKNNVEVAVLISVLTTTQLRKYTAEGVTHVWSYDNWVDEMCIEYQLNVTAEKPGNIEVDRRGVDLPTRTTFIAVGGVYDGAGSTHTSLMLAQYLAQTTRATVAVWEAGANPCFEFYDFILNGDISSERSRFNKENVTLFKGTVDYRQIKSVAHDFTYFIIDLGQIEGQNSDNIEIFADADVSVLVGSGSEWRTRDILTFCRNHMNLPQDRWRIVLPLATEAAKEQMRDVLRGRPVFNVPYQTDPFVTEDDVDETIEAILSPVLPKRRKKKFLGMF